MDEWMINDDMMDEWIWINKWNKWNEWWMDIWWYE